MKQIIQNTDILTPIDSLSATCEERQGHTHEASIPLQRACHGMHACIIMIMEIVQVGNDTIHII